MLLQAVQAEVALAGLRVLVWVSPKLWKIPPSSGQICRPGSRLRSTSAPLRTSSWQGAVRTRFGGSDLSCMTLPSPSRMPTQPTGSSGLTSSPIRSPISSRLSTPSAIAIRRSVPNRLVDDRHRSPGRPLEQQRWTARPDRPRDDLADLQGRIDGNCDPAQFSLTFQRREEISEAGVRETTRCHTGQSSTSDPPGFGDRVTGVRWRHSATRSKQLHKQHQGNTLSQQMTRQRHNIATSTFTLGPQIGSQLRSTHSIIPCQPTLISENKEANDAAPSAVDAPFRWH